MLYEVITDGVVILGELGRLIRCEAGGRPVFHCDGPDEAAAFLKGQLREGDRVLLKASRGERLERVLDIFKET